MLFSNRGLAMILPESISLRSVFGQVLESTFW